jgi:hypothetical protein
MKSEFCFKWGSHKSEPKIEIPNLGKRVLLLIQRERLATSIAASGFVHGFVGGFILFFLDKSQMKMESVPVYEDCYASQFLTLS